MEKKSNWIGKLLMEFTSVVFAVLLALGLNHWRETAAEEQIADKALANIFMEIRANQQEILGELSYYEEKIAEVTQYVEAFDQRQAPAQYSLGFNLPLLSNSAWNVAHSTGAIKDFDLQLLMELSEVYAFQDIYQRNGIAYFRDMNTVDYKKEENAEAVLSANLGQLRTYQAWSKQLIEIYEQFQETYLLQYRDILPDSVVMARQGL